MKIDFNRIIQCSKEAEEIVKITNEPEAFNMAVKQADKQTLRYVVRDILRKKEVNRSSGDTVYKLYSLMHKDYADFLSALHSKTKGDLEELCMALRNSKDKCSK